MEIWLFLLSLCPLDGTWERTEVPCPPKPPAMVEVYRDGKWVQEVDPRPVFSVTTEYRACYGPPVCVKRGQSWVGDGRMNGRAFGTISMVIP